MARAGGEGQRAGQPAGEGDRWWCCDIGVDIKDIGGEAHGDGADEDQGAGDAAANISNDGDGGGGDVPTMNFLCQNIPLVSMMMTLTMIKPVKEDVKNPIKLWFSTRD